MLHHPGRLQRQLRAVDRTRARYSTRCSCITASSAGLDAAIVNPAHIRPYAEVDATERALADDLVFNRRPDALQRFIEHFAGGDAGSRGAPRGAAVDPTAGMTADQRIHWMVVHRKKEGIEEQLDAAGRPRAARPRAQRRAAARDEGGRRQVRRRRADPPLRAAERRSDEARRAATSSSSSSDRRATPRARSCWPPCTATCTTSASRSSTRSSRNNGYTVYDLGKQVPVNTIIEKADGSRRRRDRAVGAAGLDVQADAALRAGARQTRTDISGAHRRRRDQSPIRPAGALRRRRAGRTRRACSTARTRSRGWRRWTS